MSNTPGDLPAQQGGLKDLFQSGVPKEEETGNSEVMPTWDVPLALPVEGPVEGAPEDFPMALPVEESAFPVVTPPFLLQAFPPPAAIPVAAPAEEEASEPVVPQAVPAAEPVALETAPPEAPAVEKAPPPAESLATTLVRPVPTISPPTAFDCPGLRQPQPH